MGVDIFDVDSQGDVLHDAEGAALAYFRSNWWYWRPILAFCESIAPDLMLRGGSQGSNDGDGLDAEDSHALAARITAAEQDGTLRKWVDDWEAVRAGLPKQECYLCDGTGTRDDEIGRSMGMPLKATTLEDGRLKVGWCNACDGTGLVEHRDASYPADYDFTLKWRDFLARITSRYAVY